MIQTFALRLSVSVLLDSKLLHLLFVDVSWEWVVFWSLYIYAACGNGVVGLSFSLTGPKTQEQETTCCPGQSECQGFSVPRVHLSALTPTTAFHSVFVRPESIHPVDTWLDLWSDWTFRLVVCCHTRPALRSRRCVCVCVCVWARAFGRGVYRVVLPHSGTAGLKHESWRDCVSSLLSFASAALHVTMRGPNADQY